MPTGPSGTTPNGNYPFPIQDDDVDVPRDIEALARAIDSNASAIIIGEIRTFGLAAAPARWLQCIGQAVEQGDYPELFQALGGRFNTGGESPSQFRLPAIAGRSIVGSGAGSGLTARAVAERWGTETHTLVTSQMPSHAHSNVTGADSPDHAHYTAEYTGTETADHAHSGSTGTDYPDHSHWMGNVDRWNNANRQPYSSGAAFFAAGSGGSATDGASARHTHSFSTGGRSAAHQHYFAAWSGGSNARHTHSIVAEGGGGSHPNTQPSIALLVCIYAGR